jgi:hypothetical protein
MGKAANVTVHITIEDHDDRPEQMVRDPDRYFADALCRARTRALSLSWCFCNR